MRLTALLFTTMVITKETPLVIQKYAKAFKMDSMCESATTEVLDVIWQPSKSGSLKPVVKVKPCKLAGVTIQRATDIMPLSLNSMVLA